MVILNPWSLGGEDIHISIIKKIKSMDVVLINAAYGSSGSFG